MGNYKYRGMILFLLVLFLWGCVSSSKKDDTYPMPNTAADNQQTGQEKLEKSQSSAQFDNTALDSKYRLARHFQRIKKHRIAVEVLTELTEIDPGNADAYNAMGISYDYLGDFENAQESYHTALLLESESDDVYNNLGYSYIMDKNYDAAIDALQQAIRLNPDIPRYHKNLGLAYFKSGDYDQAKAAFRVAEGKHQADNTMAKLSAFSGITIPPEDSQDKSATIGEIEDPKGNEATATKGTASGDGQSETVAAVTPSVSESTADSGSSVLTPESTQQDNATSKEASLEPVKVEIYNGNGVRRMARNVGDFLENKGMEVTRRGNADHFGHLSTIIYYKSGYENQAANLAKRLPEMQEPAKLTESTYINQPLRLLLGHDMKPLDPLFNNQMGLEVSNGNGVTGMAKRVGEYLKGKKLRVVRLTNADNFGYDQTTVFYGNGEELIAKFVAKELPGSSDAQLQSENRNGHGIRVLLGSDIAF